MGAVVRTLLAGLVVMGTLAPPASAQSPSDRRLTVDAPPLRMPVDLNPDPSVLEVNISAHLADVEVGPGLKVKAWTYDGGIPGPFLRATVGDRLIVHFTNRLPEATTIHWHGVRVPIEMDGVPGISQSPLQTGDTFTYDFVLRDAGLFWYHPHVMSAAQVGFGLYGALQVDDPADGITVDDEVTLVLSDIGFNRIGELEPAESGGPAGMVFGREGEYVLVNGRRTPTLTMRAGTLQRWRIVNTAKSRFFLIDMDGQPFTVIGGDGGLQASAVTEQTLLVTTGERVDVLVAPRGVPGSTLSVRAMLYNRGYGSVEYRDVEELMRIRFTDAPALPARAMPATARRIVPTARAGATEVPIVLTLPPAGKDGKSAFRVNGVPYWESKPFTAALGERQVWIIRNDTDWDHPFHLHGYFFLQLDERDQPVQPLAWKDTLNVSMKSTIRVLIDFNERPGQWMFHCHILDHAEGGLMGTVQVGPPSGKTHEHKPPQ
jgi:FtsP/CotA-like multicopper oxidase with cupredoxin domain